MRKEANVEASDRWRIPAAYGRWHSTEALKCKQKGDERGNI